MPGNNVVKIALKEKTINNNIVYSNRSKAVKYNLDYLNRLAKNVKGNNKSKAESLIKLYADRKISQVTTAEKQIKDFIGYPDAKDRRKKTIDGNYDKLIDKYQDIAKVNVRMKTNSKYIGGVQIKGEGNARTDIIYNIKNIETRTGGVAIFTNMHNAIYSRSYKDVETLARLKKSLKYKQCVDI